MRRTPLRHTSKKRAALNRERRKTLRTIAQTGCEARHAPVTCYGDLTPHEVLPRARGGSLTEKENIVWVCQRHNEWLSNEGQAWAYEHGLLKHSWEAAG